MRCRVAATARRPDWQVAEGAAADPRLACEELSGRVVADLLGEQTVR